MTTSTQLEPGAFVTPTIRLLRPLAEGGMGRVWVAEHLGLNAQVVVKLMADEMTARPDGVERFAREAAACAAIRSPHVVQIFDHGLTGQGIPYIVMELLEGKDLGATLFQDGPMDPTRAVALVIQMGKALAKAHKAGIVHRDIKPDNIFLCATDGGELFVKLLDFGTAKHETSTTSRTTVPGQIMGTPYYMSPEQSVGGEIDERSDIWSLGIVVFEALTGRKPFDGQSLGAITIAIHGALPKLTSFVPELPASLDAWFARACAQAPEDRFQTVREATDAFVEAVTGSMPTEQPTESVFFPMPRPKETSTPVRPVTRSMQPLSASLPERSNRKTTVAAGVVMAIAAVVCVVIVLRRPAPAEVGPETTTANAATATAPPPPAPAPAPEPPPVVATPEPAPAPPPAAAPAKHAAKGTKPAHTAGTGTGTGTHTGKTKTPAPGVKTASGGHEDDDLAKLQSAAAKHTAETPVPPAPSGEKAAPAPAPAPEKAAPAPAPEKAPEKPALPPLP